MPEPLYTQVGAVNQALIKIGAKTITAMTDGSSNAVIMSAIYLQCLEMLLEECPWSFATITNFLTPLNPPSWATGTGYLANQFVQQAGGIYICLVANTSGVFATDLANGDWQLIAGATPVASTIPNLNFGDGVSVIYKFPTGWLKLYQINFPNALIRSEYVPGVGYSFLSDTIGLIVKYTFSQQDLTTYSAKFYEALICKLAAEACFKISEASQYAQAMKGAYEAALLSAAANDGQIQTVDQISQDEWIFSRLTGGNAVVAQPNGQIGMFPLGYQDF